MPIKKDTRMETKESKLNYSDSLALERTMLAKERTYLAYFRTFIVFASSGWVIIKLDFFKEAENLSFLFFGSSLALLVVGFLSFFFMKKRLKRYLRKKH